MVHYYVCHFRLGNCSFEFMTRLWLCHFKLQDMHLVTSLLHSFKAHFICGIFNPWYVPWFSGYCRKNLADSKVCCKQLQKTSSLVALHMLNKAKIDNRQWKWIQVDSGWNKPKIFIWIVITVEHIENSLSTFWFILRSSCTWHLKCKLDSRHIVDLDSSTLRI